jgi:predicted DNA binding CopG/RHH family protein
VKRRIAAERLFVTTCSSMAGGMHLATWVSRETRERFAAVARYQGLSDSALLKRMIDLTLQSADPASTMKAVAADATAARASRLTVRLRPDDQGLLRERASARGMAPATYVSILVRSHLRSLAPLPKEELLALKRVVSELGGIGRNLKQIARAANQGERVSGPGRENVQSMIRVCVGVRDHVRELLSANLRSWEQGYGEQGH